MINEWLLDKNICMLPVIKKIQTAKLVNNGLKSQRAKTRTRMGGRTHSKHLAIHREPQDVNNFLKTTPRDRD